MNAQELSAETRRLMKEAQAKADPSILGKAYTQSAVATTGLTAYDLEGPAKMLFPTITPLRNSLPRVSGKGGIQANWRAVTAVNTGNVLPGIAAGRRGGVKTDTVTNYTAAYKGLGLEESVQFEADYAAENFDDVKAIAVETLLRSMMVAEERVILGGNCGFPLANAVTPTLTVQNTGGALANASGYGVGVVALSFEGYMLASLTTGVVQSFNRTNADATVDTINGGLSLPSGAANAATVGGTATHAIAATTTAIPGAVAYAWFWSANAGGAANFTLGAITTINSVLITANATGTAVAPGVATFASLAATSNSTNALNFDGFITFAANATLGSYQGLQATGNAGVGTPLTSDGAGGIVEIDAALKSFWDNYRLSPTTIWVGAQEMRNISAKVLSGSATAAQRFVFNADQGMIAGGTMVRSYLNKYSMDGAKEIPIRLHPNMPNGMILFTTEVLPYPLSNVTNVAQMRCRRDYYQIEWPQVTRSYQYGVYADLVLQHMFPPSLGLIYNVGNG
jgi:hypothetical protein